MNFQIAIQDQKRSNSWKNHSAVTGYPAVLRTFRAASIDILYNESHKCFDTKYYEVKGRREDIGRDMGETE